MITASGLIMTACNYRVHQIDPEPQSAQVSVHVSGFSIAMEDQPSTRAMQDVKTYEGVGAITLAFYSGTTEVYKTTQIKNNLEQGQTFGDFSCTLPLGTYTVVALGYQYNANDVFTLTSPTQAAFTSERPRETFSAVGPVNLTSTDPYDLQLKLDRISAQLNIISTDGRPQNITKIRTTFSAGSKSFNPSTGLALDDNGFSLINNPSTNVGATIKIGSFTFLSDDEQTMDITIQILDDNDNVISTKQIEDVPFKINSKTILTGPLFSATAQTSSFQLETDWLDPITVTF